MLQGRVLRGRCWVTRLLMRAADVSGGSGLFVLAEVETWRVFPRSSASSEVHLADRLGIPTRRIYAEPRGQGDASFVRCSTRSECL